MLRQQHSNRRYYTEPFEQVDLALPLPQDRNFAGVWVGGVVAAEDIVSDPSQLSIG